MTGWKYVGVKMPRALADRLRRRAAGSDQSMSAVIRAALVRAFAAEAGQ